MEMFEVGDDLRRVPTNNVVCHNVVCLVQTRVKKLSTILKEQSVIHNKSNKIKLVYLFFDALHALGV